MDQKTIADVVVALNNLEAILYWLGRGEIPKGRFTQAWALDMQPWLADLMKRIPTQEH
jgi:hypothetical protein